MAYATDQDVIDEFKSIDTSNGKITNTKIKEWIDQSDAYIDGRIGLIYQVPVTGTASKKILKNISIGLVAQRISRIIEVKSITAKGDQSMVRDLMAEAEKKLQMIVDKKLILSDATKANSLGGVASYTGSNTVTRAFDQSKDQW